MLVNKIIKIVLLLLSGVYIILQGLALEYEGTAVGALLLILLTWLYIGSVECKSKMFFWFLVTFTASQVLCYFALYAPEIENEDIDYYYYVANILYVLAYVFLIIKIFIKLDFKKVFSELTVPIIILVVLDVFCVSIIMDTTESVLSSYEYVLEYIYNAVIMILLSFALINYMYRNNNKSMLFLIGSIFIFFSEIIQLAYFYILEDDNKLGFVYSSFLVVAFVFFYLQSRIKVTEPLAAYSDDSLEV